MLINFGLVPREGEAMESNLEEENLPVPDPAEATITGELVQLQQRRAKEEPEHQRFMVELWIRQTKKQRQLKRKPTGGSSNTAQNTVAAKGVSPPQHKTVR